MNKIMAAIDIGSNSVRLLAGYFENGKFVGTRRELETTRLGAGIINNGKLSIEAMEKTIAAVNNMAGIAYSEGASVVSAVATSAVRDAVNGCDFTRACLERTGVRVDILSGDEEAALSFFGASHDEMDDIPLTVVDIGGGSTELVCGMSGKIVKLSSFNVGAVRLKDIFPPNSAGMVSDVASVKSYINTVLNVESFAIESRTRFIGIGGTITSLAAIVQKMENYNSDKVHGYTLTREIIRNFAHELASISLDERRQLKGLQESRADIIAYGAIILDCVCDKFGVCEVRVSESDILVGRICQALNNE